MIFRKMFGILRWILTICAGLLLVFNICLLIKKWLGKTFPTLFGWANAVVVSGSMEPAVQVDDMVIYHKQKDYDPEDIIVFNRDGKGIVHRIVAKSKEGFITKGDHNPSVDLQPVKARDVIGKVKFIIPKLGKGTAFMKSPAGLLLMGVLSVSLLADGFKKKA